MSIQSPLFSIIVPVYNVEDFVHKTLSSVLSQTFTQYELIVIDDGSTDKSGEICVSFSQHFPQLTYVRTKNSGVSHARNTGIALSKGEYIIFLDGDDYWLSEKTLEELAKLIQEKNMPDAILHTFKVTDLCDPEKKVETISINTQNLSGNYHIDFPELIARGIYRSSACMKIVKREIITNNNLSFPIGKRYEDSAWSFALTKHLHTYAIYDEPFYLYQASRVGSTTRSIPSKNIKDFLEIILSELNQLDEIKENHTHLYKGLLHYISNEMHFVTRFFIGLPSEEQSSLIHLLLECSKKYEHHAQVGFYAEK